jgi:hypothetical protein
MRHSQPRSQDEKQIRIRICIKSMWIRAALEWNTVIARISVTFSTLHSFISVEKIFDEHVYLTQNAHEP